MRGLPIPRYPSLRMGLPSKRALVQLWTLQRPDVVHIATEGPLGWSALQAALHLKLPVCSDFRTNFHAYSQHYGVGWLRKPIMAYLRKFHNRTQCTMVPTEALRRELAAERLPATCAVVARGVDTQQFDPARRSDGAARAAGAPATDTLVVAVRRAAWRREKNLERAAARPSSAIARARAAGAAWCWSATGRCAPSCRRAARGASSPASAAATTWRRTTPRPTCSSSRA